MNKQTNNENHCTCSTPHICCPGDYTTAYCVYCGKPIVSEETKNSVQTAFNGFLNKLGRGLDGY